MSPLCRQSTLFFQSKLTEELNSELFLTDSAISSVLHEETPCLFEGAATLLESSPTVSTGYFLPSFDGDHIGPPSAPSGDGDCVNFANFTFDACTMPFTAQPDDPIDSTYRATYIELFHNDCETCVSAQAMSIPEVSPPTPVPCDDSVTSIIETLSAAHLSPAPVDPSTMTAYRPYFDRGYNFQTPSTPGSVSVASPPSISPPTSSSRSDSSELDSEGDTNYTLLSDDDEEYHPAQVTPSQKQKKRKVAYRPKSRRATSSPARSASSGSEKSTTSHAHKRVHPYKRCIPSRNFQREGGAERVDRESDFHCPVVGCDHFQKNRRIPDLKRHILTHDRWMEPEKWICCGVSMDVAHLYERGIEEGMTEEEQIKAGAYMFRGQLRIGGCLKTFARRDALKRHVDNPSIPCIGHMKSYFY